MTKTTISDNIYAVQEQIRTACAKVNRNPDDITLVAVSKTHPESAIISALEAGLTNFGENRVKESLHKIPIVNQSVGQRPIWHYIGHIQSRQAKDIAPLADIIHSVDRLKIAHKLSDIGQNLNKPIESMIEVNISGETAKYGFNAFNWRQDNQIKNKLWQELETIISLPYIKIRGLMTMAPFYDNMEATRPTFAGLAELREEIQQDFDLKLSDLSMGMTNDFPIAIEEGATIIRLGRAIFGTH